mmetsp:Transcript_30201/g.26755  ORF Transcript_30201/g.26755 Transcript_30201/m.26755 type:complete len:238 (+) Transcript_30201:15-728(+)
MQDYMKFQNKRDKPIRFNFNKIGEGLLKQNSSFEINQNTLLTDSRLPSRLKRHLTKDYGQEPLSKIYLPQIKENDGRSSYSQASMTSKSRYEENNENPLIKILPMIKYSPKDTYSYKNFPTSRFRTPNIQLLKTKKNDNPLENFRNRVGKLKIKFHGYKITQKLTNAFDVQKAIRKSNSEEIAHLHRALSSYYLNLFHPLLEELIENEELNINFLEESLKRQEIKDRLVSFETLVEK